MNAAVAIIVMGVSGAGKTSVGQLLADRLGGRFVDADDLHFPESVRKMAAGIPLDDDDRWPWLDRVADEVQAPAPPGAPTVIACSALRRAYRDRIRAGTVGTVYFVHLHGGEETIAARMGGRGGHFMPQSLLDSQLRTLEPLEPDESGILVDIRDDVPVIVDVVLRGLPHPAAHQGEPAP